MDCSCDRCQNLCRTKPGWFSPEQIAPLARKLGSSVEALFKKYLTIDVALLGTAEKRTAIFVLAPGMVDKPSGAVSDPRTKGACVWFKDGKCAVHELKPRECAAIDHTTTPAAGDTMRAAILQQWRPHKRFLQDLYGKKLKAPEVLKEEYRKAKRRQAGADRGSDDR